MPRVPGGSRTDGGMQVPGMARPCEVVAVRLRLGLSRVLEPSAAAVASVMATVTPPSFALGTAVFRGC